MDVLTVTEAAKRCKLGESTVRLLVNRGELPVVRFGRAIRIPAAELDRVLATRMKTPLTGDEPRKVSVVERRDASAPS